MLGCPHYNEYTTNLESSSCMVEEPHTTCHRLPASISTVTLQAPNCPSAQLVRTLTTYNNSTTKHVIYTRMAAICRQYSHRLKVRLRCVRRERLFLTTSTVNSSGRTPARSMRSMICSAAGHSRHAHQRQPVLPRATWRQYLKSEQHLIAARLVLCPRTDVQQCVEGGCTANSSDFRQ